MESGLIEMFFEKVINELGATGILIVGLYLSMGKPLKQMSNTLNKIDKQLSAIVHLKSKD